MNAAKASTVARSHIVVHLCDGLRAGEATELLVHVVGARARVVAKPDTEVLHLERLLLLDLVHRDNLTGGLLHLTEHAHEVPEARLRDRLVLREDAHAVQRGDRLLLGRQVPADDHVLRDVDSHRVVCWTTSCAMPQNAKHLLGRPKLYDFTCMSDD